MNPRRLLESGWHELTRVGAKPDAEDYAQMTPEELKTQLQIIKDLQESQRKQTLELEQKEIKEEDVFNKDKEKLIRHFKKIATSLKREGCKYDWLEKPKTFNGTHSKYRQFKQSIQ
jgi:NADH:ubiquinone oxidoreductase subunit D